MKKDEQIIRIPNDLIKENYAQITFPFRKNFTLFSADFKKEGLIYHYDVKNSYQNINNYQNDKRKSFFSNNEISVYRGINGKYYISQILELNKQYFIVTQNTIVNLCILKVKDNYLLIKRNLNIPEFIKSFEYSVGKLLCSIQSIMAIDNSGKLHFNIVNLYDNAKEFIKNGGGLLIQQDENLNTNLTIIEINKSNSPYYYHVKKYQIPTFEYIYEEKNKKQRIRKLNIPKIKIKHDCDRKKD